MMVTINAIQRTFRIQYGQSIGTGFTIDVDGRQYLVTAKHVLPNVKPNDHLEISFKGAWHRVETGLVGLCPDSVDIAVLALTFQLSPTFPLPPNDREIIYGQDIYFLGFPFGLGTEIGEVNRHFPLPFIKRGTLSTIAGNASEPRIFYLDGNNNPGFSGGPVLFAPPGRPADLRVAAVISGYRFDPQPIYVGDQPTQLVARHNTGIIIAYAISHALEVIRASPIGFPIPEATPPIT